MFKNYNKSFEKTQERNYQDYFNTIDRTTATMEELTKKYQDKPDTLIEDFDYMIKHLIISIIANYFANNFLLRSDIINDVDTLIRIRKAIVNNYRNNGSSQN